MGRGCIPRCCRGLGAAAKIPEGKKQRYQQQRQGQLAPRDRDGRFIGGRRVSRRIFLAEAIGARSGCWSARHGIGQRGNILILSRRMKSFVKASFVKASFITASLVGESFGAASFGATIFIAAITTLFAAVFGANLIVAIVAAVVVGGFVGRKVGAGKSVAKSVVAKLGCGDRGGFSGWGAEIRHIGIGPLLDLTLADGCEIAGHCFFFVKADLAGVGADETFIEDAAGELIEAFVFQGAQQAGADFRGIGDGIEFDAAQLALLAKFFSEGAHVPLQLSFRPQSS